MPRAYEELTGEMDFEKAVFGQDDDRTVIGLLIDKTTVKGKAREYELETGLTYRFYGYWTEHPRYGKQFAFQSFVLAQPSGQRGTVAYLQRGPGIGRKRAEAIWELYGPAALDAIRTKPEEVAARVKGLTPQMAREAAVYFRAHVAVEATTRDLLELLTGLGTPRKLVEKLIEKWGAKAAELIRENPYRLMVFKSVGFMRADRLYLQLGGRPDAPERLGWCIQNALHKDREGHTWRPVEFGAAACINGWHGVLWAEKEHHIIIKKDAAGRQWIAESERAAAELRLANQVHRAMVEGA